MNKYNDHFYCMWHVLYGYYFELYIFFSVRQSLHLFIYSFSLFPVILFLCLLLFLVKENKMHFKYVSAFNSMTYKTRLPIGHCKARYFLLVSAKRPKLCRYWYRPLRLIRTCYRTRLSVSFGQFEVFCCLF